MTIYIGADHRGFALKERIKALLAGGAYEVEDMGAAALMSDDDYPHYAKAVAEAVAKDPSGSRGIVICGSGIGVDIVANKFAGIRAALAASADQIAEGRHDDDVNVLALAADFVDAAIAMDMVKLFLETPFDDKDERYLRRLKEIGKMETEKQ